MNFADLESHFAEIGQATEALMVNGAAFMVIKNVRIPGGTHEGKNCDIALLRSNDNPWVPENKIHVRPHLVAMGQKNSQASEVGTEWQYLSRRFDRHPATAKSFHAHLLTVLNEL